MSNEEIAIKWFELYFGYLKHITALSTGLLALMVTFLEKVFPKPKGKPFLLGAFVSFVVSVLTGAFSVVAWHEGFYQWMTYQEQWSMGVLGYLEMLTIGGFGLGVLFLSVFATINLLFAPGDRDKVQQANNLQG